MSEKEDGFFHILFQQRREFHLNSFTIDFNNYPPAPVLWVTNAIDLITFGYDWRQHLMSSSSSSLASTDSSWLSKQYQVPSVYYNLSTLPSYYDYLAQQNQTVKSLSLAEHGTSLYQYAFKTSSTALGDVTSPTAIIVIIGLIYLLRQLKSKLIIPKFSKLGQQLATTAHGEEWVIANQERILKFSEYCFRLLYHSTISIYGVYYLSWSQPWWNDSMIHCYKGYPHHDITPTLAWYYLLQCSYNLDAFISLIELSFTFTLRTPITNSSTSTPISKKRKQSLFQSPVVIKFKESVRGDFQEMLIHHIVTNMLVIGSSILRLERIGSMVFLIHDISDVPVDLSKLSNFVKWKITTIVCFLLMCLTWLYTRLYLFPFYIWWGTLKYDVYALATPINPISPLIYICYKDFFYIGMLLLILLHAFWFYMFIKIFVGIVFKFEVHDYTEHKQGEPDIAQPERMKNKLKKQQ